ncbi:MAG: hypothetical protein WBD47_14080 [Phormidesmis sp.]
MKGTGAAAALLASGSAIATMSREDDNLSEIRKLQERYDRQSAALKASVDTALKDVATAQQAAQQQSVLVEQGKGAIAQLQVSIAELKTERNRTQADFDNLAGQLNAAAEQLGKCHNDRSEQAGDLETLEIERVQLIAELYETAVEETQLAANIASL